MGLGLPTGVLLGGPRCLKEAELPSQPEMQKALAPHVLPRPVLKSHCPENKIWKTACVNVGFCLQTRPARIPS